MWNFTNCTMEIGQIFHQKMWSLLVRKQLNYNSNLTFFLQFNTKQEARNHKSVTKQNIQINRAHKSVKVGDQ